MEPTVNPYQNLNINPIVPSRKGKMNPKLIAALVVVVVIIGGYFLMNKSKKTEESKVAPTTIAEPSPTPLPEIDKKTVKIQVQNGTGTPGQAGLVVKALISAGFVSENIKTGNAPKFDNNVTTINAKNGFDNIVSGIKDSLSPTFDKITVVSPNLGKENDFDVVIVTGGKIFEEATVTPKVTEALTSIPTSTPAVSPTPTLTLTPTPTP